ncbi:iron complex transport system substrate-binding protein [Microbacterium sp. SORGH_AS428]|uniref:heme/hemin ABC transporter substrate-binding protein n=1 Tax=Microbacterium sp. SORGH_AS_0428 TaxID=3041788 RepID=UPI002861B062|nr:ABC transporter substrate-binding protein [Microbacterium sp. SORGH_AS_0428]MDR6200097.1 iron complex transport system substrate-binding protein [Microbacterium sp. SORGH_AS_0428]
MRRRLLVVAVATALALLAGCAAHDPSESPAASGSAAQPQPISELDVLEDPRSYEGPSTAVLPDAAIVPVVDGPAQSLPTTVLSHDLGGAREVTVADTSRVVAMDLAGSLAATVWGLGFGGSLVGRDVSTAFPGVEDLPVITTGGHTVSSEAVIALRPTLVITDGSIGPRDVVEQLRDVGIPVVFVENEASFAGAQQLARDMAAVFGAPAAGEALATRIGDEVERARADIAAIAPARDADRLRMVFLYLRGTAGVYYLFGEESGADEIIRALGGVDVAGELGWDGMRPLTDEAMVAANPDLILVMSGGIESVGGVDGLLAAKPAIAITTAGAHRRFVDMADGQILSFGPRSAEVLEALARAVYAPVGS